MKKFFHNILFFNWTTHLLKWVITVAGTISECAFLIASIWMCLNASVHNLILTVLPELYTVHISELATAMYVALPECIVWLAVVKTISHLQNWQYTKDKISLVWFVLFLVPTVTFALLTVITISNSVLQVGFELPGYMVVTRALSAYFFAFVSLLHTQLGAPREVNKLKEKDETIATLTKQYEDKLSTLREESHLTAMELTTQYEGKLASVNGERYTAIEELTAKLENANLTISQLNNRLYETEKAKAQLVNSLQKTSDNALEAYSQECQKWLTSGIKTASIEDVIEYTGISKRRILAAIKYKKLQTSSRNHELIVVSSLINWLETITPNEERNTDETPVLHLVNN